MNSNKRIKKLIIFTIFLMIILIIRLFEIQIIDNKYYKNKVTELGSIVSYSESTPRGKIYDRNGVLLVDNEIVKTIYYTKNNSDTYKDEIEKSYLIASYFDIDYKNLDEFNLKKFYYLKNMDKINERLTEEEKLKYKNRDIDDDEYFKIKLSKITDNDLVLDSIDKEAAYIYYLMNNGYYYSKKIIKKNVSDLEYAKAGELTSKIKGLDVKLDWERKYIYGDTLKSVLGSISYIPYELKDYYLEKGYSLNDRVGISGLEIEYENILKGTKDKYIIKNGNKEIIYGKRGNDIYLTIDINLQLEIDKILDSILHQKNKYQNTKYYDRSYVVVSDPNNGDILAISGKKIDNNIVSDCTYDIITNPITVGSVIKGASQIVGYNTGNLKIGEIRYDTCLKFKGDLKKCSYSNLGYLNDIDALAKSSNVYQYITAIKVGGSKYTYNGNLNLNDLSFPIYRNIFKEFGLGTYTGIDLPNESIGYIGKDIGNHLLDLAIGQYDNYTTIQLTQYINTLSTSNRVKLHLLKKTNDKEYDYIIYNKLNTKDEYINRVREGFRKVITSGTGTLFVNQKYSFAGKTGTSESFKDTDNDGYIDTETKTNTFVAYYPYTNPIVTFTIVSPNVSNGKYIAPINRMIAKKVTDIYLDLNKFK